MLVQRARNSRDTHTRDEPIPHDPTCDHRRPTTGASVIHSKHLPCDGAEQRHGTPVKKRSNPHPGSRSLTRHTVAVSDNNGVSRTSDMVGSFHEVAESAGAL